MKKAIASLLIFALTVSAGVCAFGLSETEADSAANHSDSETVAEAKALIQLLSDSDILGESTADNVTRGEFTAAVVGVLGGDFKTPVGQTFSDVSDSTPYASYIYRALDLGLISKDSEFNPDAPIAFTEAVKVVVSACGYSRLAEVRGGYPAGYLSAASERKLTRNMGTPEFMTKEQAAVLIGNMLNSEIPTLQSIAEDNIRYRYTGDTLLSTIHGIRRTEGIVTQNRVTSYDMSHSYSKDDKSVAVDGEAYISEDGLVDCFGMNCTVYYYDAERTGGNKEVVLACPVRNQELTVNLADVSAFDGTSLRYYPEDASREKGVRVKASYMEVYNGKAALPDRQHVANAKGSLRLIDNDQDGVYDVLCISHYTYTKVKNLNIADREIEDANSSACNIGIDEEKTLVSIQNSSGDKQELADIAAGDVLMVLKSMDGTVAEIQTLEKHSATEITGYSPSEKKISIDGEEYTVSDYAKSYCEDRFYPGARLKNFCVGYDGEIAYAEFADSDYSYGYMTALAEKGALNAQHKMKLFTASGEFRVYEFSSKVMLDGVKSKAEAVYESLMNEPLTTDPPTVGFKPQLIKYKLDSKNRITSIDRAEICKVEDIGDVWDVQRSEDDCLVKYVFSQANYVYRNGSFGTTFHISGAPLFLLPVEDGSNENIDVNKEDEFEIAATSVLVNGLSYSYFDVYDLDEYGCAAILVGRNVARTSSPHSFYSARDLNCSYAMVSSVAQAIGSSGEIGTSLELWTNGVFATYFMPKEVACPIEGRTSLEPGDIVRYRLQNNEICEMILDYDVVRHSRNKKDVRSAQFNGGNATLMYQSGKLYQCNGSFCYYSNTVDPNSGLYDFRTVNLMNSPTNTTNICRFDSETRQVETIKAEELRPYKIYGEDADYVVIKQNNLTTQCIYVFD